MDDAQPYIEGYTKCGIAPKPIETSNSSYYTGGVAAWHRNKSNAKVLYKDCYNHTKGLQAARIAMDNNTNIQQSSVYNNGRVARAGSLIRYNLI